MRCAGCGQDNRDRRKFCAECGAPLTLACPACGTVNEPGEKFCGECGTQLQGVKGFGGSGLRDSHSTLTTNPVTPNPLASGARKVVTIIFADLVGSTALHERLDAEAVRQFMESYYAAMRGAVEAHGGRVTQVMGDGVKAVFGAPRVTEDDAIRAVRAGVEMQRAFRALAEQQQGRVGKTGLRVAVNTGEVVAQEGQEIIGDPVNVAARLQEQGRDGDVVIGGSTQRLVASLVTLDRLGSFALKGRTEEVEAYRVVSLEPPTGATTTVFVGRDEELARLNAVYQAATAKPAAKLVVLVASPGLGKSRLITEFTHRLGEAATVLTAHCDAAGGTSFAPLAEALRELLSGDATHGAHGSNLSLEAVLPADIPDRARIASGIAALLAGSPASPEETFFVVRRLLAALATAKPVLLVIDDLHWAEPLLLDLVEHLVQWGGGVPLFVLVGARPELRDLRSSLVTPGGFVSDVVTLAGLDAGAATRLAANVIGAADLPAAVAVKVLATSEGNPLFVSELVRMLVQEGALTKEGQRWTTGANLAALEMPPTIHALLAARIERLRPEESAVLERAAVVGRQFSRSAVAALLPGEVADLDARLESLRRSELIERDTGWLLGEPVLRFHHVLIRDAAYRRLLKGTRAELHERLADWIGAKVGDAPEHDETIGFHLEQAYEHLRELGPLDEKGKSLGGRAAHHLSAAGRRALVRDDVPLAASLLGRAIDCLDADDPARADLALDWCEALLSAGDVGPAARAIEELDRLIREPSPGALPRADGLPPFQGSEPEASNAKAQEPERGGHSSARGHAPGEFAPPNPQPPTPNPLEVSQSRLRAWYTCFTGQLTVMTAPQELEATTTAVAEAAEEFVKLGDAAGEAKAHSVHAQALARLGRVGACEAALDKALAASRKAGDRRRANAVLAGAPLAALWGPSPVTRASGRCLDVVRVLRITQGAPAVEAVALSCQGVLEALRGRTDAARRMIASSRKMVEELGIAHRLFEADVFAGRIDLLEGNAQAAERILRGAYDGLRELGLGIDAARAGALLARALLLEGRVNEAEKLTQESEQLAGDDLQAAIAWRGVGAQALAQRGEHAEAIELAQAAVSIAAATDALLDHADARLALAAALRAAGRSSEADAEERRAIELWEAKGALLLAQRARSEKGPAVALSRSGASRARAEPTAGRRLRPNAATALSARYDAAFAARDVDALIALHSDDFSEIDHPTGASYGHAGAEISLRKLMSADNPWWRGEHLATLGDSLALGRRWFGADGGGRFDVGPYDREEIALTEINVEGRIRYVEVFAPDCLHDALVRLYERYAESLPTGAERDRAASTTRTMGLVLAAENGNIDDLATVISPGFESVDHRPLSTWSQQGGEAFVQHVRALQEVADDVAMPVVDVLALEPSAILIRRMHSGTERIGGGTYERPHLGLFVIGADGRLERYEIFDDDCDADALARFEELTGSDRPPLPRPVLSHVEGGDYRGVDEQGGKPPPDPLPGKKGEPTRRVRPNAATRTIERVDAAIAARDVDAVAATSSEKLEVLYHPTGVTYGKAGDIATWRSYFRASHLAVRHTPIATLGEWLALIHGAVSHAGIELKDGASIGPVEVDYFFLYEVDEDERGVRSEVFDTKHLGDAIARLYERYAELTAEGPERDRAVMITRAVRATGGTLELDVVEEFFAPDAECIDHRTLATWSARGRDAMAQQLRGLTEVASDVLLRDDDVVALDSGAVLTRRVNAGTARLGGGIYERALLSLFAFGADGRITRVEMFDANCEAEALARFDQLAGSDRPPLPGPVRSHVEGGGQRGVERLSASLLGKEREIRRRLNPNRATALARSFEAAFAANDTSTLESLWSQALEVTDHPNGTTYKRDGHLSSVRKLRRSRDPQLRFESLAVLGDSLCLSRRRIKAMGTSGNVFDVAQYEREEVVLVEADEAGCGLRLEVYANNHLGDSIARLYERYAQLRSEGPERDRAALTARAVRAMLTPFDLGRDFPDIEQVDHRILGSWNARGPGDVREQVRALHEVAEDASVRDDDVLALEPTALLVQRTHFGTERLGGGVYETPHLVLMGFGGDGRLARVEFFDVGQEAAALARFGELAVVEEADPFANSATRLNQRFMSAWVARDWDTIEALHAPNIVIRDRRRLMQMEGEAETNLAYLRVLFEVPGSKWVMTPIATRGQRLALSRYVFEGYAGENSGPLAIDYLGVDEVGEDGRRFVRVTLFDPDDLDAAYAELDARWQAGEAQTHPAASKFVADWLGCFAARDWDGIESLFASDLVSENHRLAGWGMIRGPSAQVATMQAQVALAPDTQAVMGHLRTSERGVLMQCAWRGTREGGLFESPWVTAVELNDRGQARRLEAWDDHRADEALARFREICAREHRGSRADIDVRSQATVSFFENVASRVYRQAVAVWQGHQPGSFSELATPDYRYRDRRRLVQLDLDLNEYTQFARSLIGMKSREVALELLGSGGEYLALMRMALELEYGDVGPSTMESVVLIETDDQGKISRQTRFDPEDEDAAFDLLSQRWLEWERVRNRAVERFTGGFRDALERRDWDAMLGLFAPDFVGHDHRLVSWGTLRGPRAFLESLRQMVELAPDVRLRAEHMRTAQRGALSSGTWIGTRDGGAFESPYISVLELNADGKALRIDFYDPQHLDRALTRVDEIGCREPSGPPTAGARNAFPDSVLASREDRGRDRLAAFAKLNAIDAMLERFQAAYDLGFESGDWSAMGEVCAPDIVFEDRRRLALVSGGLELLVDSLRERVAMGARYGGTTVGSAGNRVGIMRWLWSGGPPDGRFEIEYLAVGEVDQTGRLDAVILFDLDDARAAQREAWARWAKIEPELAETLAMVAEVNDGTNASRRERLRAQLADDLIVEDRRRTGMGHLEGGDAYADSLVALWQLAPNTEIELGWFWPVIGPQGGIFTVRRTGEIAGGGDYESDYLALLIHAEGHWKRLEFFEIDDLDGALARFNELAGLEKGIGANRGGAAQSSHQAFANAATRVPEQIARALATGDWEVFKAAHDALHSPTHHYDDRRRLMRVRTPVETSMEGLRVLFDVPGSRLKTTPLATRGERLALTRLAFEGQVDAGGGDLAIDFLAVGEMDEQGRTEIESILFDPDDLDAAYAELDARFAAGEGAAHPLALAALHSSPNMLHARDWGGFAALHAPGFDYRDHRLLGWGTVARDLESFIRVLQSLFELSSDARYFVDHVRLCTRGGLAQMTLMGTRDGGAFETPFLSVMEVDEKGRVLSRDTYDVEDHARALARFEEIRKSVPADLASSWLRRTSQLAAIAKPNAAFAALERWRGTYLIVWENGDWDSLRELHAPDMVFEDRRRFNRLSGGLELLMAAARQRAAMGARGEVRLVGTAGDRICVVSTLWTGGPSDGPYEIEYLSIHEVDESGKIKAILTFDSDEPLAVQREAWKRWAAIEPELAETLATVAEASGGFNAPNRERMRAKLADDLIVEDHRRTGMGHIEGGEAYAQSLSALRELAPNTEIELGWFWPAISPEGGLFTVRRTGEIAGGGDYESDYLALLIHAEGQWKRLEFFELEDLDAAKARFEELRSPR